ncbi:hypothetical protein [Luteimonas sp. SDU101]|uniref:hypothetical protein n=1 Tax=Luteimonas sp. SDU101 TaxID=3422593 RepID=UPI003EC0513F
MSISLEELKNITTPDPLAGICESLRARTPIPYAKRSGPSILEGLPDIHDVLELLLKVRSREALTRIAEKVRGEKLSTEPATPRRAM